MRILAASDLHSSDKGAKIIREKAEEGFDLLLLCGDLSHFGPLSWVETFLDSIEIPILALPGNCDPPQLLSLLRERGINLHGEVVELEGNLFIGFGGSNPTPFNTPFEFSEKIIYSTLSSIMRENAILVTHTPPFGYLDRTAAGTPAGSLSVARIVKEFKPRLVLSGHIHENPGIIRGKTIIVNTGPALSGHYAIVTINDEISISLEKENAIYL